MPTHTDSRDTNDKEVFRRVGILTVLWVILLILAGLALLFAGDSLFDLVV